MRISSVNNQPKIFQNQPNFKAIRTITAKKSEKIDGNWKDDINPYSKELFLILEAMKASPAIQELKARQEEYDIKLYFHDDSSHDKTNRRLFCSSKILLNISTQDPRAMRANADIRSNINVSSYGAYNLSNTLMEHSTEKGAFGIAKMRAASDMAAELLKRERVEDLNVIATPYVGNDELLQEKLISPQINTTIESLTE